MCVASKDCPCVRGSRRCDLRLTEKLIIIKAYPESLLSTPNELASNCRHTSKFTLKCFKKN